MALIILAWAGVCGLLYFFVLAPLLKDKSPPNSKTVEQKTQPEAKDPPATMKQTPDTGPFNTSFSQAEIEEAKKVVDQFVQVIYEGDRSSRDQFVNQLEQYTTDEYLSTYKQANGLGEPIKLKEKHISHIEHGESAAKGWISFNCTVVTEQGNVYSTLYYLRKQNGTWRVTEEADSFVPED